MNKKNNIIRSKKTFKYHFQRFYRLKYALNYTILIAFNIHHFSQQNAAINVRLKVGGLFLIFGRRGTNSSEKHNLINNEANFTLFSFHLSV